MEISDSNKNLLNYRDHYKHYQLIFSSTVPERIEELTCLRHLLEIVGLPYTLPALEIFAGAGETRKAWDFVFKDVGTVLHDTDIFGKETGRTHFKNFSQGDIIEVLNGFVKGNVRFGFIYVPINSLLTECINTETLDADFTFVSEILVLASQITDYVIFNCEDSRVLLNDGRNVVLEKFSQLTLDKVAEIFPEVTISKNKVYTFKAEVVQKFLPLKGVYRWSVSYSSGLYANGKLIRPINMNDIYKFGDSSHLRSLVESLSPFRLTHAALNDLYGNYLVANTDLEFDDFEDYRPRMFLFKRND